jgi:TetR/AcrR family transcriptional regulator
VVGVIASDTKRPRAPKPSATPARRTRPSADATRERILSAALEAFSERGFDGGSTTAIAARAGVTQPLLNYHFRTKDELWRAAVDGLFSLLTTTMTARIEGLRGVDERTRGELLVREFIWFSARHAQLHRIITQECKVDGPRMDWLVERHVRPLYDTTVVILKQLTDQGHIPAIPAAHLYYIITGAGPTMFVLAPEARRLTGLDVSDDEVIEAHADAVCRLLFGEA